MAQHHKLYSLVLLALLSACGSYEINKKTKMPSSTDTPTAPEADKKTEMPKASAGAALTNPGGYLQGSVVSAFEMTVDGVRYTDSEDFYTTQLALLRSEADKSGYKGYALAFDAQIGLDDLKHGMNVYVAAEGGVGYATDTAVDARGQFKVSIPDGSGGTTRYQIRTNKRVSVTLTSADQQSSVKWCYNFGGRATEGSIDAPVIINNFTAKLTQYECEVSRGGFNIPTNPKAAVAPLPSKTAASTSTSATAGAL